jgi:large subunit ribosomal protein L23
MKDPHTIILGLQLTEKSTRLTEENNAYLFRVARSANKVDVKYAVESLFNVKVSQVNTMNYAGKKRRERSAKYGRRPDWKRAVVKLAEGSKIDLT